MINSTSTRGPFAEIIGMGSLEKVYSYSRILLLLAALAAAGLLFLTVYIFFFFMRENDWAWMLDPNSLPGTLMLLVTLGLAVVAIRTVVANWNRAIALYSKGIATRDARGLTLWTWEDVESLTWEVYDQVKDYHFAKNTVGSVRNFHLHKRDGARLELTPAIPGVEELANVILQKTYPILLERAVNAFNCDHPVPFGPVSLHRQQGITIEGRAFAWSQIERVEINKAYFIVAGPQGGASSLIPRIPNFVILLELLRQMGATNANG